MDVVDFPVYALLPAPSNASTGFEVVIEDCRSVAGAIIVLFLMNVRRDVAIPQEVRLGAACRRSPQRPKRVEKPRATSA